MLLFVFRVRFVIDKLSFIFFYLVIVFVVFFGGVLVLNFRVGCRYCIGWVERSEVIIMLGFVLIRIVVWNGFSKSGEDVWVLVV